MNRYIKPIFEKIKELEYRQSFSILLKYVDDIIIDMELIKKRKLYEFNYTNPSKKKAIMFDDFLEIDFALYEVIEYRKDLRNRLGTTI